MSAGGPSKYCPRCNTAIPLRASFCDVCGYEFDLYRGSAPQSTPYGSNYGPPQYTGRDISRSWPQSQPNYFSADQPDFGYPVAPVEAPAKRSSTGKVIALLLVVVIIVGGGAATWVFYLSPSHSNSPLFDRHEVPDNVPLPNNLTFGASSSYSQSNATSSATIDEWGWQVNGSDPAAVAQFYRGAMPGKGWTSIRSETAKNGHQDVIGCQATQVLVIEAGSDTVQLTDNQGNPGPKVSAPSGGSALAIVLLTTNNTDLQKSFCSVS